MQDIDTFLSAQPADLLKIIIPLRKMVRETVPDAHEMISHGALGYSVDHSAHHRIIYIAPYSRHVNLGFFFGAGIRNTSGRLEGQGGRMRHVKVHSEKETREPLLRDLVRQAWETRPRSFSSSGPNGSPQR